mmetsp:Transcript_25639/g.78887  ORF Transcript_25639/g.78887 Transcript_25639/m.78887 type:complete len:233 (-) Transcript_25639:871-1569(-)
MAEEVELGEFGRFKAHASIPDWFVGPQQPEQACASLGRVPYAFAVQGYAGDKEPEEFVTAMRNFVAHGDEAIRRAEAYLFAYYQDTRDRRDASLATFGELDFEFPEIHAPADVWKHVKLAGTGAPSGAAFVHVRRRQYGNRAVYVLVEGSCGWDPDAGLSVVLYHGHRVTRVGAYDGHLSNADAFAMPDLEHVVYASTRHFAAAVGGSSNSQVSSALPAPFNSLCFCCGSGY